MKYPAIKFSHSNFDIITTVIPFETIKSKSKVLIYGEDQGGYQRKQDIKHFQNIRKYIQTDNYVFPNAIILACDSNILKDIITVEGSLNYINLKEGESQVFRIVDGQHRLLGIEEAAKTNPSLNQLQLQVNIISTLPTKRSIEMDIFNNINSKSKRLKTDLIELARYDYRIIEQDIKNELLPHIGINTAYELNENIDKENIWQNAIKIDIHSENKLGIISITAFRESINSIVTNNIDKNKTIIKDLNQQDLINFSRTSAKEMSRKLIEIWKIVKTKWPETFLEPYKVLDIDSEYKFIAYNTDFYIQKTLGCKSINYLIGDILKEENTNILEPIVIDRFQEIINKCRLTASDWKVGGTLSGISSESGIRKITNMIKSNETFSRRE